MNAKQLIEAAKSYLMKIETTPKHVWLTETDRYGEMMARYILATVRPDDDEPVTRERLEADGWTKSKYFTKWYITPREHLTIEVVEDGGDWFFKLGVDDVCIAKMRDIRRLVAALGE